MNFYEQPAQAQFINTYTPLPFEQLMSVANMYKQEYDKSNAQLAQFSREAGEFSSLSSKDMETWDREMEGRIKPLLDKAASNSEYMKTAEFRAEVNKTINSTNYGLLNKLKSNASMLSEAAKSYDPRWGDDTMKNITTWDTESNGMFTDRNVKYQSLGELGNPYFDLLGKGKYMGKDKSGLFDQFGLDMGHLESVASDDVVNELYTSQEGQKHVALAKQRGELKEGQDERQWLHDAIIQAQIGRIGVTDMKADPFAMEMAKERRTDARAAAKAAGKEPEPKTSVYGMMGEDAKNHFSEVVTTHPAFSKIQEGMAYKEQVAQEVNEEFKNYIQAYREGKITKAQLDKAQKQLGESVEERAGGYSNYQEGVRDGMQNIFSQHSEINVNDYRDYKNDAFNAKVYNGADAVVNAVATSSSYSDLAEFNKVVSNGEVLVNDGDIPMTGYAVKGGKGFKLITETANNLMGLEGNKRFKPNYEIKSVHGGKLNLASDLNDGNINGAVKVITGQVIATDVNGEPQLAQVVDLLIPESSLIQRGYDKKDVAKVLKASMGIEPVTNIGTKPQTEANKDVKVPFQGTWYKVKVTELMPKNDITRVETQSQVDKRFGTKYSSEAREERVGQAYAPEHYTQ